MARPRLWASDAERRAAWKARQAAGDETPGGDETGDETPAPGTKQAGQSGLVVEGYALVDGIRIPASAFDGRGIVRAYQGREYVMVTTGAPDWQHRIVTAEAWRSHLPHQCEVYSPALGRQTTRHGWQCREHAPQ